MNIIRESYRAGLFQGRFWLSNIIAGLIVGVVALPLAMAFAIASGAQPEQGIYTAIIAGFVVSVMGGSRVQIAGPTGAFIVVLSGITAKYGVDGLQIATLMAGVMLVLFGLARLGAVIQFIPAPVIIGFTSGIAIVIWVGQWQYFLGLPSPGGGHFHEKFWHLLQLMPQISMNSAALGLLSLALVLFSPKIRGLKRIPGPLVAMAVATVLQSVFHFKGVETIGSLYGGIPVGLPSFAMPDVSMGRLIELMGPAFTVAMLGAIESLLSAVIADGMTGTRHNSNQELIGQGLANILAPLFGGFAATGAVARTATSIRNGGSSPLAGIVHSLTLVMIILFFAPLAVNIPLTALSAILFMVAWNMSEARHFVKIVKTAPRADVVILLVTFLLTIFVDLVVAVNVGVIIAILHFLKRMAASIEIKPLTEAQRNQEFMSLVPYELPKDVMVYSVQGPFFFGAIETFHRAWASLDDEVNTLIIYLRWVPFADITAIHALESVIKSMQKQHKRVILCGANSRVEAKLAKSGILNTLGTANYVAQLPEAVALFSGEAAKPLVSEVV